MFAAAACVGVTLFTSTATAESVTINLKSPYMWGDGGEYVATPHNFFSPPVSLTSDGNFQTFCFQAKVHIQLDFEYSSYLSPVMPPGGPALTEQIAYLYDSFIRGTLPKYDYSNALNERTIDAGALQYAIWNLQGADTSGLQYNPLPSLTDYYVNLANANAVAGDFHNVEVLVLYTGTRDNPQYAQAQLIEPTPAPGAGTALLLGGAAVLRRRRV